MLITEEYRRLNTQLHKERGGYGSKGGKWYPRMKDFADKIGATSILDYGCGKGSLKATFDMFSHGYDIREYDPAVIGKDAPPTNADLVVCTDVLEHVEPECIDDVLRHLVELADKAVLVAIACRPGKRVLADGRPDHLTVQPPEWWHERCGRFGRFKQIESLREREYAAVLRK